MTRLKEVSFGILQDRDDETAQNKKKRAEVIARRGDCSSCGFSHRSALYLMCGLKNKQVNKYNFCEKWKEDEKEK